MFHTFRHGHRLGTIPLVAALGSVCLAEASARSSPKKSSTKPVITRDMLPPRGTTMPGPPRERIPRNPTGDHLRDSVTATLEDPNANDEERYTAVYNVEALRIREMKPVLERLAKEDPSARVRRAATHVLSLWKERDDEKARGEARIKAMKEERDRWEAMTPEERNQAGEERRKAPAKQYIKEHRAEVLADLKDPDVSKRNRAMMVATQGIDILPEAMPIIREMVVNDPVHGMRTQAMLLVSRLDGEKAIPLLRRCLGPENHIGVRSLAACQLASFRQKEALPVLMELLRSGDEYVRRDVNFALRRATGLDFGYPPQIGPWVQITEEISQARARGIEAWEQWWRANGSTFEFRAPTTGPTTRP